MNASHPIPQSPWRPIPTLASLGEVRHQSLVAVALWMALWYAAWFAQAAVHGGDSQPSQAMALLGFAPPGLWALHDFRMGLLLAIVAAPLLDAPVIPHSFTQGFGDLLAACAVLGYLWRHPHWRQWLQLWRPEYIWLCLIVLAAVVSLACSSSWRSPVPYGLKYGLAEIAGYLLAMSYMVILVHETANRRDLAAVMRALVAAIAIVGLFSLASWTATSVCAGGYATQTALTLNGALTSTFRNPNYHAFYLLTVLPLGLWHYSTRTPGSRLRAFAGTAVLLGFLFVELAISRSGFLGLVVIWTGWVLLNRWRPHTRLLTLLMAGLLSLTMVLWMYAPLACHIRTHGVDWWSEGLDFAWRNVKPIGARSLDTVKDDDSVSVRARLAMNAIRLWRESPVTGIGTAMMANDSIAGGVRNRAHNVLLTVLAEQGLLGLIAWSGWVLSLAGALWRVRAAVPQRQPELAFLGLALATVVVQSLFMDHYRALWLWQLAAMVLAISALHRAEPTKVAE